MPVPPLTLHGYLSFKCSYLQACNHHRGAPSRTQLVRHTRTHAHTHTRTRCSVQGASMPRRLSESLRRVLLNARRQTIREEQVTTRSPRCCPVLVQTRRRAHVSRRDVRMQGTRAVHTREAKGYLLPCQCVLQGLPRPRYNRGHGGKRPPTRAARTPSQRNPLAS